MARLTDTCMCQQWWGRVGSGTGVGRVHDGGRCLTAHTAGAGQSLAVLLHPKLKVGFMRRGDKQYENIILANYSPASLVLSKNSLIKKARKRTSLKNYSFKYVQKQL